MPIRNFSGILATNSSAALTAARMRLGFTSVACIERDVSIASITVASSRGTVTVACGRATPTTIAASPMSSTSSGRWRSRPGPRRTTFGSSAGLAKRAPKRPRRRSKRT